MTRTVPAPNGIATPLGDGAEFDAIRRMAARWGNRATGLGDDAALVSLPRGDVLVTSVDSAVEGRHFRRDWLSSREIGYRAVTAALSDLAAMAAAPLGILVALTVSREWRAALDDIADGIGDAVAAVDTVILGGNLSGGDGLSITTTVMGHAFAPLRRSGARAGDYIYLTGRLGGVGAALGALESGRSPTVESRQRFAAPSARVREARWLANNGATAAIDISDGLGPELAHLAAASGVRIEVDVADVPCAGGVEPMAAIRSGEEFELVVCASGPIDTVAFESRFGLPLTCIGQCRSLAWLGMTVGESGMPEGEGMTAGKVGVTAGEHGCSGVTLTDGGKPVVIPAGHDHFAV